MSLTPQHHEAIGLILGGAFTYAEVADEMKVDVRTMLRWRKQKEFSAELTMRRKAITAEVDERLAEIEMLGMQALIKAAKDGPNSFSVRAGRHLVDIAGKRLVRDTREVTPMTREERVEWMAKHVRVDELVEALGVQGVNVAH